MSPTNNNTSNVQQKQLLCLIAKNCDQVASQHTLQRFKDPVTLQHDNTIAEINYFVMF